MLDDEMKCGCKENFFISGKDFNQSLYIVLTLLLDGVVVDADCFTTDGFNDDDGIIELS